MKKPWLSISASNVADVDWAASLSKEMGPSVMTPDETVPVRDYRLRPWWLVSNTMGRAVYQILFAGLQGWLLFSNNRRSPLPPLLLAGWAALIVIIFLAAVVTVLAFVRHPDWVNKDWPKRALTRRTVTLLASGIAIGAAATIVGVIVAVVTSSGAAIAVTLISFSLAAICGATLTIRQREASHRT